MTAATVQKQKRIVSEKKIPECLIYEMADNLPIYYRGYRDVVRGRKQTEEIMSSSFIQSLIISRLFRFLIGELPEMYEILTNEIGLWFSKNSWRASILRKFFQYEVVVQVYLSSAISGFFLTYIIYPEGFQHS